MRMGAVVSAVWLSLVGASCGDSSDRPPGDAAAPCSADSDCDDGRYCNGVESCDPSSPSAGADGCATNDPPCLASQTCDEAADVCISDCAVAADADGDGVDAMECGGTDCDDSDADRFPGAPEVCDDGDVDEDCDDTTFGDRDADGDGAIDAACCNGSTCGTDCDDTMASVNPMGTEACDARDNDCDGSTDEGVQSALYPDVDGDGFGDADGAATMGCPALLPALVADATDCDDSEPSRNPGASEVCDDGIWDNNCDDASPFDDDADMFDRATCGGRDCDDTDRMIFPGAPEICDTVDQDCDGLASDDDGDGILATTDPCTGGPLDVPAAMRTDCDDRVGLGRFAFPGATEICDSVDNDCDGTVDEGGFAEPINTGPTVTTTTGTRGADFSCMPTAPSPGATRSYTIGVRDSADMGVTNTPVEIFRDNVISGTCAAPSCSSVRTDIFGNVTATLAEGGWFAVRTAPTTTLVERLEYNLVAPTSIPYQVDIGALSHADLAMFRIALALPDIPDTGILEAELRECPTTPGQPGLDVRGAYLRVYDATSSPVCGLYVYESSAGPPSFAERWTGDRGRGFVWGVPAAAGLGTSYFVEFWVYDPMTSSKVMVGREVARVRRGAITSLEIGPTRADGPVR